MYEQLKALAEKSGLTADDKVFIEECSKELGVKLVLKKGCEDCHLDQIFKLTAKIEAQNAIPKEGDYILKAGVDVKYKGIRVNNTTLTDSIAEKMVNEGHTHLFAKYKVNENK